MTHLQQLFINNLRFYRSKAGYTQLEFSELIDLSPNYLNAVENGKNFPSPEVLQKIADRLHLLPYQLFLEEPTTESLDMNPQAQQLISDLRRKIISVFDEVNNNAKNHAKKRGVWDGQEKEKLFMSHHIFML